MGKLFYARRENSFIIEWTEAGIRNVNCKSASDC